MNIPTFRGHLGDMSRNDSDVAISTTRHRGKRHDIPGMLCIMSGSRRVVTFAPRKKQKNFGERCSYDRRCAGARRATSRDGGVERGRSVRPPWRSWRKLHNIMKRNSKTFSEGNVAWCLISFPFQTGIGHKTGIKQGLNPSLWEQLFSRGEFPRKSTYCTSPLGKYLLTYLCQKNWV